MVNQTPVNGHKALFMIGNVNVFFNATNIWVVFFNVFLLSRVVRQANFITVWGIFRVSSGAVDWWNSKRVTAYHEHHEKS